MQFLFPLVQAKTTLHSLFQINMLTKDLNLECSESDSEHERILNFLVPVTIFSSAIYTLATISPLGYCRIDTEVHHVANKVHRFIIFKEALYRAA